MTNETKWTIDKSHSEIAFKVRHLMITHVNGTFKTFDANIRTSGKEFATAEVDLWIDPASINTNDEKRDEHLVGADFFDVQNHKQITFISSSVGGADGNGIHELWGDLTIKGITKNVMLNVQFGGILKDPYGNEKAGFNVKGKINRSDWGLIWNTTMETGGMLVSDEVTIECEIELTNSTAKNLAEEPKQTNSKEEKIAPLKTHFLIDPVQEIEAL